MREIKQIIWDFDGVIIISDTVRVKGFEAIFKDYPEQKVDQLLSYHNENGGLSRYVKIRYFFESVLGKDISEAKVKVLADEFSRIMKEELTNKALLNKDWLAFMEQHGQNFEHHIASGSDGNELRFLCEKLGIEDYFVSINGSPTPKKQLVKDILHNSAFGRQETILIGDAVNDYDAAHYGQIDFYGYNNDDLKDLGSGYIATFVKSFLILGK